MVRAYEDLRYLSVGTQLGGRYFPRFDNDTKLEKHPVNNTELNVKMLLAGHIDTFVQTETAGDYRLAKLGFSDTVTKAEYVYRKEQEVYMILSKRSPLAGRLADFNRIVRTLLDQGEYERIKAGFLNPEESAPAEAPTSSQ